MDRCASKWIASSPVTVREKQHSGNRRSRRRIVEVRLRGRDLLHDPLLNKGSAFTAEERQAFGLEGLLPHRPISMEQQAARTWRNCGAYSDPLKKYVFLASLQDRNEHLYFRLLRDHLVELMPIVYTPTVGLATQRFSHVFQRGRGLWITPDMRGRIPQVLRNWARGRDVRLLVVTDNESILGIGDQGAGGMAIAIGKLALYTAGAGIDPAQVLPVSLDVGTDNEGLRSDPAYLGWPQPRLRGDAYLALLDEFVAAVAECFPAAMIQWEDFRKDNALHVLDRYADRLPSFNDDIQGTGAMALAGILSAARVHGRSLAAERIVILGAGAAGLGIARQLRAGLKARGVAERDARHAIAAMDSRGLLVAGSELRDGYKRELAWDPDVAAQYGLAAGSDLATVVRQFQPTVLIGTSGQPGAFSEAIVRDLAARTERPVIMPLSNPSALAEAQPEDLIAWTDGRALVSAGSPFPSVRWRDREIAIGQGNNAFIFPGVGLAVLVGAIGCVSDELFFAAAEALAGAVTPQELQRGLLYPGIQRMPDVARAVARAVLERARSLGLTRRNDEVPVDAALDAAQWEPVYPVYVAADPASRD
ncbi:MAG: NAD-dependent malic enzyme [Gammaproteobacteria bacterium]|nr:MAG: NAD-dependent malic enzyme [Gammaproteobacteria bacterium]